MKKIFVEDLKDGELINSVFLVRDKKLATTKNDRPYININLIDRTGKVTARVWERRDEPDYIRGLFESFDKNDFVKIQGKIQTYKDNTQIIIDAIKIVEPDKVDISDFVPKGEIDVDKIVKEFTKITAGIDNPHLKKLLSAFLKDRYFMEKFKIAPAAKKLHQAYIGGLIEHTLNLVKMARDIADYYPHINRDLLLTGTILHDIGKIEELDYERSFDYTDRGRLLGHIFIGANMVAEKIKEIKGFPSGLEDMLIHIILSHHGEREFGSPVVPVIPEALILHHIDNLDARVWGFAGEIARSEDVSGNWTGYSNVYQRYIFKGDTSFGSGEGNRKEKGKDSGDVKNPTPGLFDND